MPKLLNFTHLFFVPAHLISQEPLWRKVRYAGGRPPTSSPAPRGLRTGTPMTVSPAAARRLICSSQDCRPSKDRNPRGILLPGLAISFHRAKKKTCAPDRRKV